ncbi:MAG: hypothetical protein AAF226_10915 [Verrucomicrobiota bacterium]
MATTTRNVIFFLFACLLMVPATHAQSSGKLLKVWQHDTEKLLEYEEEEVRIQGFVKSTNVNQTGIHFINFDGSEFVCVTFGRYLTNFAEGPPTEIYNEKWIEVSGTLQNYRGTPQIRLTSPNQVKIIEAPELPKPETNVTETTTEQTGDADAVVEVAAEEETKPEAPQGPVVEVIDGVQAIEWRQFFPDASEAK